jgi:hypothetical protein
MTFVLLAVLLIGLNAASYVQKDKTRDTEFAPNRSTFNTGATGTQALYTLLAETGRQVIRWQLPPELLDTAKNPPSVFAMIGPLKRDVTESEKTSLLRWVSDGGTLVVIDREPEKDLLTTTSNWKIWSSDNPAVDLLAVDPADQKQMTTGADVAKFIQPSGYSRGVNAVQPSRFASWIAFERFPEYKQGDKSTRQPPPPAVRQFAGDQTARLLQIEPDPMPTPPPDDSEDESLPEIYKPTFNAPVVHMTSGEKNLLVDVPFGSGTIIYLTDPYIVSNAGINMVDNAQLAINLLTAAGGPIAFDEYHHGYGAGNNRFLEYFEGTPVISIFLQCALVIAAIFYSQSRRFSRPLPDEGTDRLSKLEYVSAMADMQLRLKAYDLALENIYTDFRRRCSRTLGVDNTTTSRAELARMIAGRIGGNAGEIEQLMFKCEDIIHGEPTSKREVVDLTTRLREIGEQLGIKRSPGTKV